MIIQTLFFTSDQKLSSYSYLTYLESVALSLTHYEKTLTPETNSQFVNLTRSYLPPNRYWLDNRDPPIFPAVHGDKAAFCAYNQNHSECKNFKPPTTVKPNISKMPNVVLIAYESLTPSYYLINNSFIIEHSNITEEDPRRLITDRQYYNSEIVKELAEIQNISITFAGVSSFGLPTNSGFSSLLTGLTPAQTYLNILDGALIQSDDVSSHMKQIGYRTLFISASEFNFDGQNYWVFRRPAKEEAKVRLKCNESYGDMYNDPIQHLLIPNSSWPQLNFNCKEEEINSLTMKMIEKGFDMPEWFDYAQAYYPKQGMEKLLNIEEGSIRTKGATWPSDRLLSKEFQLHWGQQKDFLVRENKSNIPIFGVLLTIDSHLPYVGYDKPEYYDSINNSKELNQEELRRERFKNVNKFASKWSVGDVIKYLKENDNNTIFIITGDHGTRDIPIREKDSKVINDVVYSSDCVHGSSGTDSLFVVSGMIGYLGDDPNIKKALGLDKLSGKTIKVPTDHSDLIYTIEDIVSKLNGTNLLPTHRRSRNLIDLSLDIYNDINNNVTNENIMKKIDKSNWKSISLITYNLEYREGIKVLKTHCGDPNGSHYYNDTSFPTCLRKVSKSPMKLGTNEGKEMYKRMYKYLNVETFMNYHNRLYNYKFRNMSCVENGKCEFPTPKKLKFYDYYFIFITLGASALIMLLVGILVEASIAIYGSVKINKNKIDIEVELFEEEDSSQHEIEGNYKV
ncbi:Sulfatase [Histomonas meleagridis]|uniref:Sulfatase n=1 Tax=Histomonas meleagridis TaxID=135588 RepID=UPI0035597E55|nr:Sulfatase [Histomonas meleagridis]KAH0796388.1 Sulfatase [Histomonas meleagridis]